MRRHHKATADEKGYAVRVVPDLQHERSEQPLRTTQLKVHSCYQDVHEMCSAMQRRCYSEHQPVGQMSTLTPPFREALLQTHSGNHQPLVTSGPLCMQPICQPIEGNDGVHPQLDREFRPLVEK